MVVWNREHEHANVHLSSHMTTPSDGYMPGLRVQSPVSVPVLMAVPAAKPTGILVPVMITSCDIYQDVSI